jgi:hypothetical protein
MRQIEFARSCGSNGPTGEIGNTFSERLDERAALLAHHWDELGDVAMSARWHAQEDDRWRPARARKPPTISKPEQAGYGDGGWEREPVTCRAER